MRAVDQQRSAWTIVSTAFAVMRRVECAEREGRSRRTRGFARGINLPIESRFQSRTLRGFSLRRACAPDHDCARIHACIESGKRVLFVGSERSDIHLLARRALPSGQNHRIDVGDVDGLVGALHATERAVASGRQSGVPQIDQCTSVDRIPAPGSFATEHVRI